jgi:fatty acid-binding protein DegV
MALAKICLSFEDSQIPIVRDVTTPKKALKLLSKQHKDKGIAYKAYLRKRFHNARMENGETVTEYLNNVVKLKQQLEQLGAKIDEYDLIITILNGLPDKFQNIVVALQCAKDLNVDVVRARLIHEEMKHLEQEETPKEAFFVRKREKHSKFNGNKPSVMIEQLMQSEKEIFR